MSATDCTQPPSNCRGARLTGICATWPAQEIRTGHTARKLGTALRSLAFALKLSICEQWGLRAPLGAAELYREGPCCWRCLFPTSLMIRGHCPVFPDQHLPLRTPDSRQEPTRFHLNLRAFTSIFFRKKRVKKHIQI